MSSSVFSLFHLPPLPSFFLFSPPSPTSPLYYTTPTNQPSLPTWSRSLARRTSSPSSSPFSPNNSLPLAPPPPELVKQPIQPRTSSTNSTTTSSRACPPARASSSCSTQRRTTRTEEEQERIRWSRGCLRSFSIWLGEFLRALEGLEVGRERNALGSWSRRRAEGRWRRKRE